MVYKTINISPELHKVLRIRAAETGLTIAELVEDACEVYLTPSKKELAGDSKPNLGKSGKTATEAAILQETKHAKPSPEAIKAFNRNFNLCKHGAMPSLCKFSKCKK